MSVARKRVLTALVVAFCIATFTLVSVAWFAGYRETDPGAFITSNNPKMPNVAMWMYYSENDGANSNSPETWVSGNTSAGGDYILIPGVQQNVAEDGKVSYTPSSLHFGKVDNLITLNPDNKVYIRLEFDAAIHGHSFLEVEYAYNTTGYSYEETPSIYDSIYLYDLTTSKLIDLRAAVNEDDHVIDFDHDRPEAMQFLQVRYAISTSQLTPNDASFASLTFSDSVLINCGGASSCEKCKEGTCGAWTVSGDKLPSTGKYYVYLEMAPHLETFGMQDNMLNYFVPAYMLFDVKFSVEIG
jgi:hypothetical protein